ncbi:DUF4157 domain-containing protein [Fluviicola sp.]|uniref:eCIS core domain-containing protein n=1 Tax=Fluviicola sp. TaxID=1917219 RepID=UPI00262F8834|nr:DUF4157 domain-containing protein [Fluviicola sp.]
MKTRVKQKQLNNPSVQTKAKNQAPKKSILQAYKSGTTQLAAEEEEPVQGKPETTQLKENKTGLPDNLKSGVENLSGHSLDDVKVHYNSDKPSALQAHAYAQGTDIHVAPGQEKHLPHEAWHVVQQKQGRVQPTRQLKGTTNINDDSALEKEADVMGAKSLSATEVTEKKTLSNSKSQQETAQLVEWYHNKETNRYFDIEHTGTSIKAKEVTLSKNGNRGTHNKKTAQTGKLIYSYINLGHDQLYVVLEHVKSHPEEGSGLGALLVNLMAMDALSKGATGAVVSKPATTQQGFYQRMGFDIAGAKEAVRQKYIDAGREEDIPEEITIQEAQTTPHDLFNNSSSSVNKRWRISSPEQTDLPTGEVRDPDFGQSTRLLGQISNEDL